MNPTPQHFNSAELATRKHMQLVAKLLGQFAQELITRAFRHDESKLTLVEIGPLARLQAITEAEGPAAFGTPEYIERAASLGPMLVNHYAMNSHHPEHFENGVKGMSLVDLVEMSLDWVAAADRNGDAAVNLTYCAERYAISPDLLLIIKNTYNRMGTAWK